MVELPCNTEKAADIIMRQIEKVDQAFEELMKDRDEKRRPDYVKDIYNPAVLPLVEVLKKLDL